MEILISGQLQPFDDRALNIQVLRWTHSFWTTELAYRKEKKCLVITQPDIHCLIYTTMATDWSLSSNQCHVCQFPLSAD